MRALSVDVGSTSIKSAIVDDAGTIHDISSVPTPAAEPTTQPGRHETDPELIVAAVRGLIDERILAEPGIDAVAFSTQMHGALLTDTEGRPATGYMSWQDERGFEPGPQEAGTAASRLAAKAGPDAIARTGIPLRPGLPSTNVFAVLETLPTAAGLRLHTLGSFLTERLTGRAITHLTSAASTGLVDVATGDWDAAMIDALGLTRQQLPAIAPGFGPVGRYAGPCGPIDVFPDVGDQQATVEGIGLRPDRDILVSIGTAGLASCLTSEAGAAAITGRAATAENRPSARGMRLPTISRLPGGRMLDLFTGLLGSVGETVFEVGDAAVRAREAVPHLANANVPMAGVTLVETTDRRLQARIDGITPATFTAPGLIAGLREAFVNAYTDAVTALSGTREPERIVLAGGAARVVGPWLSDSFGDRVTTVGGGETALLGLASLLAQPPALPHIHLQCSPEEHR